MADFAVPIMVRETAFPQRHLVTCIRSSAHCFLAEAFDGGEDFVGGSDPPVWLRVFVAPFDEGDDVGFEFRRGSMDAAL